MLQWVVFEYFKKILNYIDFLLALFNVMFNIINMCRYYIKYVFNKVSIDIVNKKKGTD